MRFLMVFFILLTFISCKKDKCYDCYQNIEITVNKEVPGYPLKSKIKIVACGSTNIIDNPSPIVFKDTVGDTIWSYWKDTDCFEQELF